MGMQCQQDMPNAVAIQSSAVAADAAAVDLWSSTKPDTSAAAAVIMLRVFHFVTV